MIKTTAQRIKEIRKVLGKPAGKQLSQEKLGNYAGVTKAAVSQWEREISLPERDSVLLLQKNLGINPDWLMHGKGAMFQKPNKPAQMERYQITENNDVEYVTENIIVAINTLTHDQIDFIKTYIEICKKQNEENQQLIEEEHACEPDPYNPDD